ncbi:AAA family ATPase [Rhizobium rhizogenes]|uniref:AAA family ATPase n=1 Tax=Rhizobium rhizogenes TaxID=359 RepID=UPI0015743347|nr:AAA family ATPase [Rhizobium rhizogenes]NTG41134.1 AAA family ATPase [Rhizobium rhizogenes]
MTPEDYERETEELRNELETSRKETQWERERRVKAELDLLHANKSELLKKGLAKGKSWQSTAIDASGPLVIPDMLIDGIMVQEGFGMLIGAPGAGKGQVLMELMYSVATGEDFIGHKVTERRGVLYITFEGSSGIAPRWRATLRKYDAIGEKLPVYHVPCPDLMNENPAWDNFMTTVQEINEDCLTKYGFPLGLVIIDTIAASAMVSEENSTDGWKIPVANMQTLARDFGAFFMVVHHQGKGENVGNDGRGSSHPTGASDTILVAKATKTGDGEFKRAWLVLGKIKDGGDPGYLADFKATSVHVGETTRGKLVYAKYIDFFEKEKSVDSDEPKDPLGDQAARHRAVLASICAVVDTNCHAPQGIARERYYRDCKDGTQDQKKNWFDNSLKALVKSGLVVKDGTSLTVSLDVEAA